MLQENDIAIAWIKFEDKEGEKLRPVLFLYMGGQDYIVFEIRSSYGDEGHFNPTYHQSAYFYELQDWQLEGLDRRSWVNAEYEVAISKYDFKEMRVEAIGHLTLQDLKDLNTWLSNLSVVNTCRKD